MIDFGQAESYSRSGSAFGTDDRTRLIELLKGIQDEDEKRLVRAALSLRRPGSGAPPSRAALERRVRAALLRVQGKPPSERIIGMVNELSEASVPLERRFSFGVLKGLMIAEGEGYVPDGEFEKELRSEAERLMRSKLPVAVAGPAVDCLVRGFEKVTGR